MFKNVVYYKTILITSLVLTLNICYNGSNKENKMEKMNIGAGTSNVSTDFMIGTDFLIEYTDISCQAIDPISTEDGNHG